MINMNAVLIGSLSLMLSAVHRGASFKLPTDPSQLVGTALDMKHLFSAHSIDRLLGSSYVRAALCVGGGMCVGMCVCVCVCMCVCAHSCI